jgi:uncharacterized protein
VALLSLVVLFAPLFAGCLGGGDAPVPPPEHEGRLPLPGWQVDESLLSPASHDIKPRVIEYAVMDDGVKTYIEVYLPDGEGPWPTILEVSPYNQWRLTVTAEPGLLGEPRTDLVNRYVPRSYAVVLAHLRGSGNSEGCIDMMGPREQKDTHDIVDWVAAQPWSDGKVGMHGVSYVGTTPHMAAIHAPEALVTIVTVAGVTNQWRNVYMNGVPYDGRYYPIIYEAYNGVPPPTHASAGADWLLAVASGAGCVNTEAIEAMRPGVYEKGLYTAYWDERNLTKGVANVKASMLYSQGFADRAVNPSEAVHWYNEYPAPKKAFLHQGGHMYPPREDYRTVELAWFDHWLKGIENGVMESAPVEVLTNRETIRVSADWPPTDTTPHRLYLAPGELVEAAPAEASESYLADLWRSQTAPDLIIPGYPQNGLRYITPALEADLHMAGQATFHLRASSDAANTFFLADLFEVQGDDRTWVAEGWMNAHLRDGFDRSAPLTLHVPVRGAGVGVRGGSPHRDRDPRPRRPCRPRGRTRDDEHRLLRRRGLLGGASGRADARGVSDPGPHIAHGSAVTSASAVSAFASSTTQPSS